MRSEPPWLDSLNRPWTDALASPRGQHVAVARVRAGGSDTYVISADKRDTIPIVVGKGDAKPLGWSPDGKWLLATTTRTLSDGTFDADLFAYGITGASPMVVVDSSSRRSVTEAAWAPDGSRIAWVARAGAERQLEVFTSLSDGTGVQNVSRHPADDQHISWSPDGELLAFTSTRDGNSELYAVSARENRRWRLTRDPAQDDLARFSANGRMVAFESTRGGTIGVYVMPALGGEPHRIGGSAPLSLVSWRGGRMRFIDRVRVQTRHELEQGETTRVELLAFDQFGDVMTTHVTDLQALDSALVRVIAPMDSAAPQWAIVARRPGIARVVASLGRWRFDTTEIRVGRESLILLDAAADPANEWMSLGEPLPRFDRAAPGSVVLNADREWESGVLSRRAAPLLPGLTLSVVVQAPIGSAHDAAMAVSIALVASETEESIDRAAPQFLRYVSFGWNADADRLVYSVGREIFTESVETITAAPKIPVRLRIESDSTVSFTVAGQQRWRSTLRAISARHESRAQVWLGGRATEGLVRLSDIDLRLAGGSARTGRD